MHQPRPVLILALGLAMAVAACTSENVPVPSFDAAGPSTGSASTGPTFTISFNPTLAPSVPPTIEIDSLPDAALDPATTTAICDPNAGQALAAPGDTMLDCVDGLRLARRAIRTVTDAAVTRMYLQRLTCSKAPCSDASLNTALVTGWTAGGTFRVALDARSTAVIGPEAIRAADVAWPAVALAPERAVKRPILAGAPAEVARRAPLPYCGRAEVGLPASTMGCFRRAILSGRPAEIDQQLFGTEGGSVVAIDRYAGGGAVVHYLEADGAWHRQTGSIVLGVEPDGWSFVPWADDTIIR